MRMDGIERKASAVVDDAESKFVDLRIVSALDSGEDAMRTVRFHGWCCVNCWDTRAPNFDEVVILDVVASLDGIVRRLGAVESSLDEPVVSCVIHGSVDLNR